MVAGRGYRGLRTRILGLPRCTPGQALLRVALDGSQGVQGAVRGSAGRGLGDPGAACGGVVDAVDAHGLDGRTGGDHAQYSPNR